MVRSVTISSSSPSSFVQVGRVQCVDALVDAVVELVAEQVWNFLIFLAIGIFSLLSHCIKWILLGVCGVNCYGEDQDQGFDYTEQIA